MIIIRIIIIILLSQLKEMEKKKKRGKENRETGLKKKGAKLLRDVSVLLKKVNES